MVARQTLTLFVWVRILVRLPLKPLIFRISGFLFFLRSIIVHMKERDCTQVWTIPLLFI